MIKAIIFDVDNTLIDFLKMKRHCLIAAVDAMIAAGLKAKRDDALRWIYGFYEKHGYEHGYVFERMLKAMHKAMDFKILATGIQAYRKARVDRVFAYPNVKKTLMALKKRNMKLCIVSDAPKLNAYGRLVAMGIVDLFDFVIAFEDTHHHKPHSLPFVKALEKLQCKPEEVLMIGDRLDRDVLGAQKMGIKSCLAAYGAKAYDPSKAGGMQPDAVAYTFSELKKIVNVLSGAHTDAQKRKRRSQFSF